MSYFETHRVISIGFLLECVEPKISLVHDSHTKTRKTENINPIIICYTLAYEIINIGFTPKSDILQRCKEGDELRMGFNLAITNKRKNPMEG